MPKELTIRINAKDTASRTVRTLETRFRGLGRSLTGVTSTAGKAAKAIGKIAAVAGAAISAIGGLAGAMLAMGAARAIWERAKEQSNDLGRELARLDTILNRVAATIGNFLAPFFSILADWLDALIPKTLSTAEVFETDFVKSLMNTAEKALRWGVEITVQLARGLMEGAKTAIQVAMNFIQDLLGYFMAPGSPPRIAPLIDEWGAAAMEQYLQGFTEADFGILEGIQGSLQTVLDLVGNSDAFTDLSIQISQAIATGSGFEQLLEDLTKAGKGFGKQLAELARRHLGVADAVRAVEQAEQRLEDSRKAVSEQAGEVERLRAEYAKMKQAGASPELLRAKDKEIDAAQAALHTTEEAALQAEKDIAAAESRREEAEKQVTLQERLLGQLTKMEQFEQNLAQAALNVASAIGSAMAAGGGAGGWQPPSIDFEELKKKIKGKLKDIFKPLKQFWEEEVKGPDGLLAQIQASWEELKQSFDPLIKAVEDVWDPENGIMANLLGGVTPEILTPMLDSLYTATKDWATNQWNEAWEPVKYFFNPQGGPGTLVEWLNNTSASLTTWLNETAASIGTWATEQWTAAWEPIKHFFSLEGGEGTLVGWLNNTATAIGTWLSETWQSLYDAGASIVQGLIDGINSKLTEMVQSIRDIGQNILSAWNEFWKSHSPSQRAMEEMGKPIVAGIGEAFSRYAPIAEEPLEQMIAGPKNPPAYSAAYTTTNNLAGATFNIYDRASAALVLDQERRRRLAILGA